MSGHTPGPWVASTTPAGRGKVANADGFSVANTTAGPYATQVANAHLIAAAPDLYSAIVELLDASNIAELPLREESERLVRAEDAARAAIKKARGEK